MDYDIPSALAAKMSSFIDISIETTKKYRMLSFTKHDFNYKITSKSSKELSINF